ncbi:hypothetical protein [Nocardia brasiliensis]|uniref:hypothetical protein n=1 Tax=Nocardia brasiliensis TaxID=37326 RepID=UPI0018949575|nr:hypothetical protein [Nocardia brasiliensis]MBF6547298.1 hypothetical protein [Nocardia brasiliensis]
MPQIGLIAARGLADEGGEGFDEAGGIGPAALTLGTAITAAGFGYMAVWSAHPYDMMISLGLMGLGFGVAFPTLMTVIVHSVPVANVAETTGMNTVVRMLGGAIGTQVTAALIASHQRDGLPTQAGFTASYLTLAAFMVVAALAAVAVGARRSA